MDEVWNMEQDFWLEGASFYERHLDPECIMAFPRPAGIMDRLAILETSGTLHVGSPQS